MELVTYVVALAVGGLVLGALARLALPGPDPMGVFATIAVGVAGSFVAGLISALVFGREYGSLLLAFVCTFLIVYLIRRSRGGTLTRPAPRGGRSRRR